MLDLLTKAAVLLMYAAILAKGIVRVVVEATKLPLVLEAAIPSYSTTAGKAVTTGPGPAITAELAFFITSSNPSGIGTLDVATPLNEPRDCVEKDDAILLNDSMGSITEVAVAVRLKNVNGGDAVRDSVLSTPPGLMGRGGECGIALAAVDSTEASSAMTANLEYAGMISCRVL